MSLNLFDERILKPERSLAYFSECEKGLPSYYNSPNHDSLNQIVCRNCKSGYVNWDLTRQRNIEKINDVAYELKKEWWRNYWWEMELDELTTSNLKKTNLTKLEIDAYKRIRSSIGKVYLFKDKLQPFNDGYQTPYVGNIIYYGQHAMATCCRSCVEYWHGIPRGRALNDDEVTYLSELTLFYIKAKLVESSSV